MSESPSFPIYQKNTEALGRLLSTANISYEAGTEWARAEGILSIGEKKATFTNTLPRGLRRNLLDRGLIPFLTEILEDKRVEFSSAGLLPYCPDSAVSI